MLHSPRCRQCELLNLVLLQVAAGALNFVLGFGCVTASYTMSLIPKTQVIGPFRSKRLTRQ